MLWSGNDDEANQKKHDLEARTVHYIEGMPLPDWETEYEQLEAFDIYEKSAMRLFQKAAREDNVEVLRQLVKSSRVNPNLRDSKGWTALLRASKCNSIEAVDWLCRAKADVNSANKTLNTPLMKATKSRHVGVVSVLVFHKADAERKNQGGASALMQACQHTEETGLVSMLLEAKAEINYKKPDVHYTALMLAARHANNDAVNELLLHSADMEMKDVQGETALAKAVKYKNDEVAENLRRQGAKPVTVTVVGRLNGSAHRRSRSVGDSARMSSQEGRGRSKSREKGGRSGSQARSTSRGQSRSASAQRSGGR